MQNPDNKNQTTKIIQGRIVWKSGDLFKGKPETDFNTRAPKLDKTGKQKINYGFGLAVPIMVNGQPNPQLKDLLDTMQTEARKVFTSGHYPPDFAWKFKTPETVDKKGVLYGQRDGYEGCYVFSLTTNLPIAWFAYQNGQNVQISEGVKCGDYVDVNIGIKAHPAIGQGKPGMYLNPLAARLIGYGEEIVASEADGDSIFGTSAPSIPQGASTQPVAPQGFPQMGQQQQMQQPMGFPGQPVAQPYHNVLPPNMQPPSQPLANGFPGQQQTSGTPQQFTQTNQQQGHQMGTGFNPGQPAPTGYPTQPAAAQGGMIPQFGQQQQQQQPQGFPNPFQQG